MLTEKRYEVILDLLEENEVIKLSTIAGATNSSESTIRRDLISLEEKGLLKRVHGGAKSLSLKLNKTPFKNTTSKNIYEKKKIGEFASSLVENENYIFLDESNMTYEMIDGLKGKNIVVVTNSLKHLEKLIHNKIRCYFLGGEIDIEKGAVFGSEALTSLRKFTFDKVFLGVTGIHEEFGFTVDSVEEASIKEEAIKNSIKAYILADNSKINIKSKVKFKNLKENIVITDKKSNIENLKFENVIKIS